jgi:hypothetical protein
MRRVDRRGYLYGNRSWPDGVALGATVVLPDGPLDGREIEVKVVAKRDVDAASRAELQKTRAYLERLRQSEPDP